MVFSRLKRGYKNINRLRQIINILIEYGFDYFVKQLGLIKLPTKSEKILKLKPSKIDQTPLPMRVRLTLEELGPTFVKLGQILSTRPDIIPLKYIKELEKLQDKVPPFAYAQVEQIVHKELGANVSELFQSFEEKPFASASLGQVHKAILKEDKVKVVVKVQRPDMEKIIETDLDILFHLTRLAERHIPESRLYDPVGVAEEFAKTIRMELDYGTEGRNAERFRKNFEEEKTIYIPKVYWELSSKRILTMEYIDGIKINHLKELEEAGYDRKKLAENGAKSFMKQMLIDGFFHADPHPGNILVMENEIIGFMDFGMTGKIDEETKEKYVNLLIAVLERNSNKILTEILNLGFTSQETIDTRSLKTDIADLLDQYYDKALKEIKLGEFITHLVQISIKYHIKMPAELALLGKSLLTIEGIGLALDPDFNLTEIAKPYVKDIILERKSPQHLLLKLSNDLSEFYNLMFLIPKQLSKTLKKMEEGIFKLELQHRGLENLINALDKATNRLSYSLILVAIIIGSSLIMQTEKGPQFMGFPVIGVIGFLISGILGLGLVIMILRSGKM
ncbi:MAG: AarF/ABC1/UbiB kinase family protein [Atribacterota bacterium]|nr:AarF/ABC1/UbiB kinase family protein [Atribacterota bacterium]MDD4289368.1 AarF/ABC1/UbiB kinase family protein [Atribacterota bacterium]